MTQPSPVDLEKTAGSAVAREQAATCGSCGNPDRASFYAPADIVQCLACGVLYVSPRPTAQAIAKFYSAAGHYDHWDTEPGRPAMWARRTKRILRLGGQGRLLDIGAGQGDFGAVARAHFEVDGTEVSSEGQRQARERHGLALRLGDALELDLPKAHYDVVTLWHVLEHVAEPRLLLHRCQQLLRPDGLLCVAVPNANHRLCLTRAWLSSIWQASAARPRGRALPFPRLMLEKVTEELHLTHFTLTTLTELVERAGFRVVERGLDDHSADNSWRERARHHGHNVVLRATGVCAAGALFVAGRKRGAGGEHADVLPRP